MILSDPPDESDQGLRGVRVGVVTDNEDAEGMARVKLRYPWRDADDESYWARIAAPMAGADRGTYFLPEVGDEVLVAFENGDIHHPYVLGALWNGQEKPPESNDGNNDVRTIRSRSGHELSFDDASEGEVTLTTSGGHSVVLDDASDDGITLTTSGGNSIVLDDGGSTISIEDSSGGNSVVLDATTGAVDLTAGTKVSVSAPALDLVGDGSVNVEATGVLTLKGSIVKIN